MIFTPYLFALHAAILMYILQKINSIRSLSVFVQCSLLLMSDLDYDTNKSESASYMNIIISIDKATVNLSYTLCILYKIWNEEKY
jgi:hypothetical protein